MSNTHHVTSKADETHQAVSTLLTESAIACTVVLSLRAHSRTGQNVRINALRLVSCAQLQLAHRVGRELAFELRTYDTTWLDD